MGSLNLAPFTPQYCLYLPSCIYSNLLNLSRPFYEINTNGCLPYVPNHLLYISGYPYYKDIATLFVEFIKERDIDRTVQSKKTTY